MVVYFIHISLYVVYIKFAFIQFMEYSQPIANEISVTLFPGTVTELISGQDGRQGAVYSIRYIKDGVKQIDHLIEDYLEGSVKIID